MFKKRILSAVIVLMLIFSSIGMTAAFAADTLASVLTWDVIANNQLKTDVVSNLNLVNSVVLNGETVSVAWSSSNEVAISSKTGVVTRDYESNTVMLTAKAGGSSVSFDVIVSSYMQGNIVEEYSHNFEDYNLGDDVDGEKIRVSYVNDKGTEFKVTKDYVTGTDNKVLSMDIIGGPQQMSSSDKALCTKEITYTGTFYNGKEQSSSKSYTWKVMPERKKNDIGYYYCGYRTDINPNNKSYWAGVYVDENDNVIPKYVYTYGGVTYITNDGSPYLPKVLLENNGNPRPVTMDIATIRPQERGGAYAYSFRFGMRKYNEDGSVRNINGFTDKPELKIVADGAYFTFDYATGGAQTNGFYQGRIAGTKIQGSEVKVHIDNNGKIGNGVEAQYVGKTADMKGIYDNTDNFDHIKLPTPGEWADVQFVYDMSNLTATLYFNGKPAFFRAAGESGNVYTSIIDMTYGRGGSYLDPPRIQIYENQSVYMDKEFMFDNYSVKVISANEQVDKLLNDVANNPYIRVADDGAKLVLENKDNYVTYVAADTEKVKITDGIATITPSVGFGTEKVVITATAQTNATTVTYGDNDAISSIDYNPITKTKDIEIILDKDTPYEVQSLALKDSSSNAGVYTPAAGTKLTGINVKKNIDHVASDAYVAVYNANGVLTSIVTKPILQDGRVEVEIENTSDVSYEVFLLERGMLKPLAVKTVSLPQADDEVKVFVLGDQNGSISTDITNNFTANVTVDTTFAKATAKGALSKGGLDYVLANADEGDHVVINLSSADAAEVTAEEYEIYLTQIVKAVKKNGLVPVLVFSYENSEYFNKSINVSSANAIAVTSGIAGVTISSQIAKKKLPIAKYVINN